MRKENLQVLLPIGRLLMGSLYKANDKNMKGGPLVDRNGKSRVEYFIGLGIPKKGENHWNQTEWGNLIYEFALKLYPNGQIQLPNFSWKIADGDSDVPRPNRSQVLVRPCDRDGYPGHWIIHMKNGFAPVLCDAKGVLLNKPEDFIKCGDYIHVYLTVASNEDQQRPGLFLTQTHIAFIGYGERIGTGIDPTTIGFGGALPTGASSTPISSSFNPVAATPPVMTAVPPPHTAILRPKVMLPAANGIPYESYVQQGWTDALLIQHGYMQA